MRALLFLILAVLCMDGYGQRRRTTATFDADTTTRPTVGTYGIGIRDKQPWLVSPEGEARRFVMEDKFVAAHWFSVEADTAELPTNKSFIFLGGGDSTYVKLPVEPDTAKSGRIYQILFFGWKGGSDSTTYMQEDVSRYLGSDSVWRTFKIMFSDTIHYQKVWKGPIYKSKEFSDRSGLEYAFFIYPRRWIYIRKEDDKWWLF